MIRPKVAFWLGSYSIQKESPSGIGQRLIQIVSGLRGICEVKVVCTQDEAEPDPAIADTLTTDIGLALSWANALYAFDNVPAEILESVWQEDKVIVAENHTPVEHFYYQLGSPTASTAAHRTALSTYRTQLRVANKFVVRSQTERIAVLDGLCLAGRIDHLSVLQDESLCRLVELIPIGVLSEEISHPPPSYSSGSSIVPIVWNGGLYDFHNPAFLIEAAATLALRGRIQFFFPFPAAAETSVMRSLRAAVNRHALGETVSLGHVMDAREALCSGDAVLACVGRRSVENELCQRLRTREIFRFRSPMIVDDLGATGDWIRTAGVGTALHSDLQRATLQLEAITKPGNRSLLTQAIDRHLPFVLLDQPLAKLGGEIARLVTERKALSVRDRRRASSDSFRSAQ